MKTEKPKRQPQRNDTDQPSLRMRRLFARSRGRTGPAPTLPPLNSAKAPADEIASADLNEFRQIFGEHD